MTGNIKQHYFASRSFDVVIVGDDDGLDARAKAPQSPDDVGHIQCLSRSHDACLEHLQTRMGDDLDFLLQNAPLALVERLGLGERDDHISFRRPAELVACDGGGAVGGSPFFSSSLRYRACL